MGIYTRWLAGGTLLALAIIAWCAYRRRPDAVLRWLDVGIAAVVGGVFGARALHVALEWSYFRDHTDEIIRLSSGGLAWHGALLAGLGAALLIAWVRRVPFTLWTDAAALALPVGMIAAWLACRGAGAAYGYEVATLADWPGWLVGELPDVYGVIAPRLEVQRAGAVFGGVLLGVAALLTWRGWLPGVRLWLVLGLTGLGFSLLGFLRADPSPEWLDRRADQILDLLVLLLSTLSGSIIWLVTHRTRAPMEGKSHENYAGAGPNTP